MHSGFGTVNPELRVTLLEALRIITNQEWHLRQEPPPPIPPSGLFDIRRRRVIPIPVIPGLLQ